MTIEKIIHSFLLKSILDPQYLIGLVITGDFKDAKKSIKAILQNQYVATEIWEEIIKNKYIWLKIEHLQNCIRNAYCGADYAKFCKELYNYIHHTTDIRS
jgi:hypothetical protein